METDLKIAAVAQITIMDAQNLVDELERLRMAYAKQISVLSIILKGFSDLFCEVTDHQSSRRWLSKQIERAEREANRQRIPAWFWRIDIEQSIHHQLTHRAKWLLSEFKEIHPDDLWANLSDCFNYSGLTVDTVAIQKAISGAFDATQSTG